MRNNHSFSRWLAALLLLWGSLYLQAVVVSTVGGLETAFDNANGGGDKEIVLINGTYVLDDFLAVWEDGITVRSQSGNRDDVKIYGQGMTGGVTHIFNGPGSDFTVRDMTIGRVSNHAIQIWGNAGASNILISNLRIVDTYEQMVKISFEDGNPNSSENGVMENCLLEYTAGIGPQWYIGGIDGHQAKNWIVRNNVFKYISSPSGDVAEHAVHFWSDSEDTLVENNRIIDCDRGIGFGLGDRGHEGGIIRNNMIYHSSTDHGFADVAIGLENASNVNVYNNTVYMANSYPNAVEYRFPGTSGGIIRNNLCNKAITSRDGGSAGVSNNITNAQGSWFVNLPSGDLHLANAVSQVVDQGVAVNGLTSDFDGDSRPQGAGIDIGADEYVTAVPASITVTSPNGGESWQGGAIYSVTWGTTGTMGNVKIAYSVNNGSSWSTVISSTPNDGTYPWTVPDTESSQCLVRVSEASEGSPSDTSDAVFSIVSDDMPEITLSRDQLTFGALTSGITTGAQSFSVSNTGEGTLSWQLGNISDWMNCSPTSGTGPGAVTVSVDITGLSAGTYSGKLRVKDPGASNSPQPVSITLNVYATGGDAPPFGSFDTPLEGSSVRSSVPVTGWALDDVGVESVKIYRDAVSGEGGGLVYIGDALMVEGARPDIEPGYPGYPMNDSAGWGYMMLSNFLPNGGNGTFVLYALARDVSGQEVVLGSKTITCDNINAVKPFGAIDTPAPGGTVSGDNYRNVGWVLTPIPNEIPGDGSTITVYVDGAALGHPVYNVYRSDIAALFPGYSNSDGAAAYFDFDTTAFSNGVHTISWSATDNAGNTDGIGSRYFTVRNSEQERGGTRDERRGTKDEGRGTRERFSRFEMMPGAWENPRAVQGGSTRRVARRVVEIEELERVELHFVEGDSALVFCRGYLVVGGRMGFLPVGSMLDSEEGVFYWQPGVGFLGDYEFIFIMEEETEGIRTYRVRVRIVPKFTTR